MTLPACSLPTCQMGFCCRFLRWVGCISEMWFENIASLFVLLLTLGSPWESSIHSTDVSGALFYPKVLQIFLTGMESSISLLKSTVNLCCAYLCIWISVNTCRCTTSYMCPCRFSWSCVFVCPCLSWGSVLFMAGALSTTLSMRITKQQVLQIRRTLSAAEQWWHWPGEELPSAQTLSPKLSRLSVILFSAEGAISVFPHILLFCSCLLGWAEGRRESSSQVSALLHLSKWDCKHRSCFPDNIHQGWRNSRGQTWTVTASCPCEMSELDQFHWRFHLDVLFLSWSHLLTSQANERNFTTERHRDACKTCSCACAKSSHIYMVIWTHLYVSSQAHIHRCVCISRTYIDENTHNVPPQAGICTHKWACRHWVWLGWN